MSITPIGLLEVHWGEYVLTNTLLDALIAVATQNGLIDLEDHDFRILYARPVENDDRIVARLVAVKDGVIKAKIEPRADGKDQREAFLAFKKDVEVRLDRILQGVPNGSESTSAAPSDAPPAYGTENGGLSDRKA